MKLLLVRHAESEGNRAQVIQGQQEHPLSKQGQAQAQHLAQYLQANSWEPTHLYASPLQRALETARICTVSRSLSIQTDPKLLEVHNGVVQGLTWDQVQSQYPKLCQALSQSPLWVPIPKAEPPQAVFARAGQFIQQLLQHHGSGDRLWVFSHGGILQHLIAHLLGCDRVWGIAISPTALFEFEINLEQWHLQGCDRYTGHLTKILQFNTTPHLSSPSS